MLLLETLLRGLGDLKSSDPHVVLACKLQSEVGNLQKQERLHDHASRNEVPDSIIYTTCSQPGQHTAVDTRLAKKSLASGVADPLSRKRTIQPA
jgi:hypothetical protein